jgi:hypothetical protein
MPPEVVMPVVMDLWTHMQDMAESPLPIPLAGEEDMERDHQVPEIQQEQMLASTP